MSLKPRYIVGIDLGTTTCSLSYIDRLSLEQKPQLLDIPQRHDQNSTIKNNILPSFCYLLVKSQIKQTRLGGEEKFLEKPKEWEMPFSSTVDEE